MKERKFAVTGIVISLIVISSLYYTNSMVGFPDGHLTEFDWFYKKVIFPIFMTINVLFLMIFSTFIYVKKKAGYLLIAQLLVLIIYTVVNYYFSIHLENGQGG
ncbi:hypothetical protein [Maribacter sp.]|uniref:hypothetical protein n=1 Tax=Maribacter sp. TaxID=1897614 RepID=UPI003299C207